MSDRRTGRKGVNRQGVKPRGVATDTPTKLRRLDIAWMASHRPPRPDYLVDGIVARGEVTVLWGAPGIGKSLCSEAFTRGVALGEPVAGRDCKQGRVLYLDAENGEYEIHRRVRGLGLPADSVEIYDASASVHVVADFEEILEVVKHEAPDMVVLDSLRRLTPGSEENDSGAMADAIGAIKAIAQQADCGVLVIHHARKDGGEYRGSSAIRDQVSISWQLSRGESDVDRSRRVLRNDKMRIGPEPGALYLRIVHDGRSIGIVAADEPQPSEMLASGRVRGGIAGDILEVLENGPLSRPAIARALGRSAKDQTVRRAVEDLEERGLVLREAGRVSLVSSGGLTPDTLTPQDEGVTKGVSGDGVTPPRKTRRKARS